MAKQEILPPIPQQRDNGGKFKPGGGGGPGRPPGAENLLARELKQMTLDALHQLGGVNYLIAVGATKPEVFCGLLGKILPAANATDPNAAGPIVEIRRTVVMPKPRK